MPTEIEINGTTITTYGDRAKREQIVDATPCDARDGDVDLLVMPDEDQDDCLSAASVAVGEIVDVSWAEWSDDQRTYVHVRGSLR